MTCNDVIFAQFHENPWSMLFFVCISWSILILRHSLSVLFSCCCVRRCVYSGPHSADGRMNGELWIGRDVEGTGHGLMEVLSRNLSYTEENHENNVVAEIRPIRVGIPCNLLSCITSHSSGQWKVQGYVMLQVVLYRPAFLWVTC
jgi:hypothetical protein